MTYIFYFHTEDAILHRLQFYTLRVMDNAAKYFIQIFEKVREYM